MYKCKHFIIQELVPKRVFEERGEKAWQLLDENALRTLDQLRKKFGKITINNWYWNDDRNWSGLRTKESPYGTKYSQHRFGRAFDCIFAETDAETVRKDILDCPDEFPFINSIELETSWLHFDTRNCDRIMTYKP